MSTRTLCTLLLVLLAVCPAFAAAPDSQFNGRWDIKSFDPERPRAWWLEIEGAGTPTPKGKFISAFNGDLNVIQEISIKDGRLQFGWQHKQREREGGEVVTRHLVYTATLKGRKLNGTFQVEGQSEPPLPWVGVRAPEIRDEDDGSWKEGQPVELFDGKDLAGWAPIAKKGGSVNVAESGWSVKDGLLTSTGGAVNIASVPKFWNFVLHVEYRIRAHSNSGIGLRDRYEVQIIDDFGHPPSTHGSGALYSRILPAENASKPAGEWETYDIRLVGRIVTITLNGKKVIDKGVVEGLTAMASNSDEGVPGPISLQGDHGPVEFRKITLTPLKK